MIAVLARVEKICSSACIDGTSRIEIAGEVRARERICSVKESLR